MTQRRKSGRRKSGRHLPPPPTTLGQEVEGWLLEPDEGRLRLTGGRIYAAGLDVEGRRPYRRLLRRLGLGLLVMRDRLRRRPRSN